MNNIITLSPDTTKYDTNSVQMNKSESINKKLFVLDLDETLLYQRQPLMIENYESLQSAYTQILDYNVYELMLSIQEFIEDGQPQYLLGVYRPHLMEFISRFVSDYDFVLYTAAPIRNAAFHMVLIEMYFNYYYRLVVNKQKHVFYFKSGIFPSEGAYKKSIVTLSKLVDLRGYSELVIVDDMLYNANVWDLKQQHTVSKSLRLLGFGIKQWDMGYGYDPNILALDSQSVEHIFDDQASKYYKINDTELLRDGSGRPSA